jgi:hypothetical protein
MRGIVKGCVAIVLWACLSGSAGALIINTLNSPTAFTISSDVGGGSVLIATGTVTVTSGFNSSFLTLHVILNNTSTLNGTPYALADNVRLTGWGFGVNPNATGVTFSDVADGGLIDATLDSLPGLAGIEICAWGGNNCSGGANGGIQASSGDTFDLILAGIWGNSVVFDPLGVKFQTGFGSFEFACTGSCTGGDLPPAAVPEPQTLALVGLGLFGLAMTRRRAQMR